MNFIFTILLLGGVVFGMKSCIDHENEPTVKAAREARQLERETPHVIRVTDDGCMVYQFQANGDWRYFTRCENSKTETTWREKCGKHCTREVSLGNQ